MGISPPLCCPETKQHFCLTQTLAEFYSMLWAIVCFAGKTGFFFLILVSYKYTSNLRWSWSGVIPLKTPGSVGSAFAIRKPQGSLTSLIVPGGVSWFKP